MSEVVVQTREGAIRGVRLDGIVRFLGIPYAAAPAGSRRFEAPVAHDGWTGVRDAAEPGPSAPHSVKPFPGLDVEPLIGAGWRKGDDYLNLNVWAPGGLEDGRMRPVMVWIHGGGFVLGSNYAAIQDGAAFARSGVVCIAINYRMGVEGFLPIPGVPTNLGLRDILFALRWVRDNAAAFGGDPENVTVFGESAGAMAIADLITSPPARGLFRRAIVESGHGAMVRPVAVAQRLVRKVAKLLGVTPDEAGFRGTSPEACVAAVEKISLPTARIDLRDPEGREPAFGISRFVPVYATTYCPKNRSMRWRRGPARTSSC
jgi:para-nitrobenzyl esterase